jgi:hypothetical protein
MKAYEVVTTKGLISYIEGKHKRMSFFQSENDAKTFINRNIIDGKPIIVEVEIKLVTKQEEIKDPHPEHIMD